jgi:hypothetical protein
VQSKPIAFSVTFVFWHDTIIMLENPGTAFHVSHNHNLHLTAFPYNKFQKKRLSAISPGQYELPRQ